MTDLLDFLLYTKTHSYCLSSTGTDMKNSYHSSRKEAEAVMNRYCSEHGIKVECSEYDKHERKYTNHNGVRFYINRM